MPTLAQLKSKWFIAMDGTSPDGVPRQRHTPGTGAGDYALADSTDGNTVTPIIDGKDFMKKWHDLVVALHGQTNAELYLAGWRLEGVKTLGESIPSSDALEILDEADENGVYIRIILSDHLTMRHVNLPSIYWLLANGVVAVPDYRYPPAGSNHFKFSVIKGSGDPLALLGSMDISKTRWDDSTHLAINNERGTSISPRGLMQVPATHDTGVLVEGPAVAELEKVFRERWNDLSYPPVLPNITKPFATPSAGGTHSIQVLRTYGIADLLAYSWSKRGEFTVWASYLNAIKKASTYIYIEDQYFLPFDWPPSFAATGMARDTDIVYQLGEAIKRGVRVFVVTPSNAEDLGKGKSKYHRDLGINYLRSVKAGGALGEIVVASLESGGSDVYVHSKLMIVDDELVLIGNANIGQRSMTCDGEAHLAIVDSAELLAKNFRVALWMEFLGTRIDLDDPVNAFATMSAAVTAEAGLLKPYPVDVNAVYPATAISTRPEKGHAAWMRNIFDPYHGPKSIR